MSIDFAGFSARLAATAAPPGAAELRLPSSTPGESVAYELHLPEGAVKRVLVFVHGGGAHRRAGYDRMAQELSRTAQVAVCLPDLRGHGASDGRRGHIARPQLACEDLDLLLRAMRERFVDARVYLGGHSSGAGLVLNFLTSKSLTRSPDGVVMLAPEFGFRAKLYRKASAPFGHVRIWPFLIDAFSGGAFGGGIEAVRFDYGGAPLFDGCLTAYTVGMANAVTPSAPAGQLASLAVPLVVALAGKDELIDPDRCRAFLAEHGANVLACDALPETKHLDIILDAADFLRRALVILEGGSK